ncbi:MAG: cell surface protein SprA [Chlorobi bacterium]|nr:cell surface protein SprA [Chlorobiota bacterium]
MFFILIPIYSFSSANEISKLNIIFNHKTLQHLTGIDDSTKVDTGTQLPYSFKDESEFPYYEKEDESPLFLKKPSNINSEIQYNPETGEYEFIQKIGKFNYRPTGTMNFEEYRKYDFDNALQNYWRQRVRSENFEHQGSLIPKLYVGSEVFDRIFGSNTIDIKPQGSAELIFGIVTNKSENPNLSVRQQKNTSFDFKEKIQMNVTGKIGDNLQLGINYDTEATFEFENKTNLKFEGKEDDIIQKIEAGNVSMPLTGSLISGSQTLFGFLTELQFGKLSVTSVFSQQKGETSVIEVQGGAQRNDFEFYADDYDANRHFFLSHYFRDNYELNLSQLPQIRSGVNITRIEVWITNKRGDFERSRNVIAFQDLAETVTNNGNHIFSYPNVMPTPGIVKNYPTDSINTLESYIGGADGFNALRDFNSLNQYLSQFSVDNFVGGQDYELIESARLLDRSEYSVNSALGYISLNQSLNADEILAVAYEYTLNGKTYKVGELSSDGIEAPKTLVVKLIKGTNLSPRFYTWDLMMKNVYAIGGYQIKPADFKLDILYYDDETGTPLTAIKEGNIANDRLLHVMKMDELTSTGARTERGDNVFDFIENATIDTKKGRIFFPELEPFGNDLRSKIGDNDIADKYVYQELYDSTQSTARQIAEKNKFILKGEYQSSSSNEISLNAFNIPRGSVNVSANGRTLVENQDYTVDYMLGRVKILDQGLLASGVPIKVSLESNSLFSMQSKSLVGTHLDYRFNDDMHLGATIMNLTEKPITKKVNIGEEPISNTIWGFNGSFRKEVPFLTRLIDMIPLIETKEMSIITINGEFAHLIPGHSRALDKEGVSYIDDFEGSKSTINIKSPESWFLASTPQGQENTLFPEGSLRGNLEMGYNRAKLAWYRIDPLFTERNSPVDVELQSNPVVYRVNEQDLFPFRESQNGIPTNIPVLNLSYFPEERGPYNYDINSLDPETGKFTNPEDRWAGIMRRITTNDFEEANVEFIEFWMMDPFWDENNDNPGGELYFNLGNISEDILNDGRKSFEDGLPGSSSDSIKVDTTVWGVVPSGQALINAFENDPEARKKQDVGLDGLSDEDERSMFSNYLDSLRNKYPKVYNLVKDDPSSDDFAYFRSSDYSDQMSIIDRYKKYNGLEGNSPTSSQSGENYSTSATPRPDVEDINQDYNLSQNESYYQYKIEITPDALSDNNIGNNYITDIRKTTVTYENKEKAVIRWIQFKVPIYKPQKIVGPIDDFKSIRFIRMFLKNFTKETHLRFAELDLVRGEWRKYNFPMFEESEVLNYDVDSSASAFNVSVVNIEENGHRKPVNYVLPPGIDRVTDPSNPQLRQLNEQSLSIRIDSLNDGYAKAVYKNVFLDVRQYKKLQFEVHAEAIDEAYLDDDEITAFIRLGSDYQDNYYEYEIPLKLTPHLQSGLYNNDLTSDRLIVWPDSNRIAFEFLELQETKKARNKAGYALTKLFSKKFGRAIVSIRGNPNLSNVKTIMIGVRNPKQDRNPLVDDGLPKSAEVWFNELRLTDFNEYGGWAANTQVTAKLADFGSIAFSGNTSTPGFGSIEKKVNDRSKEKVIQYDVSSNFELGKFLPEKAKVNIPLHMGLSESMVNPLYDPLDQDIELEATLNNLATEEEKKEYLKAAQSYSKRRSINLTNVRVQPRRGKTKFYSLSNWTASYAYNDFFMRNINTEWNFLKDYNGTLSYNYSKRPKNIAPFKKSKLFSSKYLKLIKDFNFFYLPSSFSFRTNMIRKYNEIQLRNVNNLDQDFYPTWDRQFKWTRVYDLKYDLTRSLKFDFSANNLADVLEIPIDEIGDKFNHNQNKDKILGSIKNGGRNIKYDHRFNLSYTIPINKIPLFDWVSSTLRYSGTYVWESVLPYDVDTIDLGNTIRNSNSINASLRLNMTNFYNKVGYLKSVNDKFKKKNRPQKGKNEVEEVSYQVKNVNLKARIPKIILHKLRTEDIEVKAVDKDKKPVKGDFEIINENRATFTAEEDAENVTIVVAGKREIIENPLKIVLDYTLGALMGIKDVSVTYSNSNGTILPGYMGQTKYLGLENNTGKWNPGLPFIAGVQQSDIVNKMMGEDMLTKDTTVLNPYSMNASSNFNLRSTIEPLPGLKISVTAIRSMSKSFSEIYIYDQNIAGVHYRKDGARTTGNFTISTISWNTAFGDLTINNGSKAFEDLRNNRLKIANRLAGKREELLNYNLDLYNPANEANNLNAIEKNYPYGYYPSSQEVLIHSFIAAYTGKDANTMALNVFPKIPLPNWKINYDGLSNIEFIKQYIRSINVTHSYSSTYSIGGYETNPNFNDNNDNQISFILDEAEKNYISEFDISGITISEQFSPLIGVDMTWNNSLISKIEIKKNRSINFSLKNYQVTETIGNDLVIGAGYRIKDVEIAIKSGGRTRPFKSDLNVRADVTYRKLLSVTRKVNENTSDVTGGQNALSIKLSADYVLSERFNIKIFYDRVGNTPQTANAFKTSTGKFGVSVRFTLV